MKYSQNLSMNQLNCLDYMHTPYSSHIKDFIKAHIHPVHQSILDNIAKELNK